MCEEAERTVGKFAGREVISEPYFPPEVERCAMDGCDGVAYSVMYVAGVYHKTALHFCERHSAFSFYIELMKG